MKKEDWQTIKQIFDDALAVPTVDRSAFLDSAAGSDLEIRIEVERLLSAYESGFLEDTAMSAAAEALVASGLTTGQIIGRYKIAELIGTGGMGEVFRADDTELDRSVAFKVLHRDVAEDEERVRRFIQEARAASALNHPNILTIHEIGTFEGSRFIVSEYVDGETLRERMHDGLTASESVDITCQIAAALQAAHSAGIVHRDIKPENVMIRKDGLVKVLDFGLAKLTEADDLPIDVSAPVSRIHTSPGLVMGTVAYMSPEQAKGQPVDARTDLWSLGVVLHEMLTGSSPFDGDSVTELISSIIRKDTSPAHLENLPFELRPICQKALAKNKDSRYRSAHDLLKDLEGEKKRMEYAIQPSPYISSSGTDDLRTQLIRRRPTLSAEYIVTSVKRHKYVTLAAAAAILVVGITFSVYKFRGATPTDDASSGIVINANTTEKDLKFTRLAGPQRMFDIAISPDGRFIAYTTGITAWTKSIHVREMATQHDSELVPAPPLADGTYDYSMLSFAPDDSRLLYSFSTQNFSTIFSVALGGGPPSRVADNTSSASISPDGRRIAFDRTIFGDHHEWKAEDLVVADVNGGNENVLVHMTDENQFLITGAPAWSADSKAIACWFNIIENDAEYGKLFAIRTDDASREPFSDIKWSARTAAIWMPDGSLIVTGAEKDSGSDVQQLWRVTHSQAKRITNDPAGYYELSATRDGSSLVTIQNVRRRDLWVMNGTDPLSARQITFSGELEPNNGFEQLWDGSVIINSSIAKSSDTDLWSISLDGKTRRQLTANAGANFEARTTPDGRTILFTSDRAKSYHVYRMDADGGNVKQLTDKPRTRCISISPDGRWIYYRATDDTSRQIFKMPIDGGVSTPIATVNSKGIWYDIAPDGRIAESYTDAQSGQKELRIYARDGVMAKSIPLPPTAAVERPIHWTPDAKSVAFDDRSNGGANIWMIAANGNGKPRQLTNFPNATTGDFNWSRDGRQMFVTRNTLTSDGLLITNVGQ